MVVGGRLDLVWFEGGDSSCQIWFLKKVAIRLVRSGSRKRRRSPPLSPDLGWSWRRFCRDQQQESVLKERGRERDKEKERPETEREKADRLTTVALDGAGEDKRSTSRSSATFLEIMAISSAGSGLSPTRESADDRRHRLHCQSKSRSSPALMAALQYF